MYILSGRVDNVRERERGWASPLQGTPACRQLCRRRTRSSPPHSRPSCPRPPICNLASSRWVPRCPDQVADRGSDATLGQGPRIRKCSEASPLLALFGVKCYLVVLRPVLPAPPRTEVTGGDPLHRSRPGDAARRLRPSLRNAQVCPSAIFFLRTTLPPDPRLPLVLRPSQMPPFGLLRCREALSLLRSPPLGTL